MIERKICLFSYKGKCILDEKVESIIDDIEFSLSREAELSKKLKILRSKSSDKKINELEKLIEGSACENCTLKRRKKDGIIEPLSLDELKVYYTKIANLKS